MSRSDEGLFLMLSKKQYHYVEEIVIEYDCLKKTLTSTRQTGDSKILTHRYVSYT